MKKYLLFVILPTALIISVFLVRDFVKAWIVTPLFIAGKIIINLPQDAPWYLFLGILLFLVLKNLNSLSDIHFRSSRLTRKSSGKIEKLTRLVFMAQKSEYWRKRLARHLSGLAVEILSHRLRLDPEGVKEKILADQISMQPDVLAYLQQGLTLDRWDSTRHNKHDKIPKLDPELLKLNPETILTYLETQLENPSGI